MFFVIAFHFSDHGNVELSCAQELTISWAVLATARIFGALCNCAFMLISGYFLSQKEFRFRSIFKLWLQVWFYSVILGIACYMLHTEPLTAKSLIKMLFPFLYNEYWYFSTYIVIYLFSPFLNRLIAGLTQRQHLGIIALGLCLFSALPTFAMTWWLNGTNSIEIFLVLYFVGAYLNKYRVEVVKRKTALLSLLLAGLEIISLFAMRIVYRYTGRDVPTHFVWATNKVLPVALSIVLFLLFKQIQVRNKRAVAFVSSSVFGVYLFHIGRLNVFLFKILFDDSVTYGTNRLILQMMTAMCLIFAAAILFDKIRICIFERPLMKVLDPALNKIDTFLQAYHP